MVAEELLQGHLRVQDQAIIQAASLQDAYPLAALQTGGRLAAVAFARFPRATPRIYVAARKQALGRTAQAAGGEGPQRSRTLCDGCRGVRDCTTTCRRRPSEGAQVRENAATGYRRCPSRACRLSLPRRHPVYTTAALSDEIDALMEEARHHKAPPPGGAAGEHVSLQSSRLQLGVGALLVAVMLLWMTAAGFTQRGARSVAAVGATNRSDLAAAAAAIAAATAEAVAAAMQDGQQSADNGSQSADWPPAHWSPAAREMLLLLRARPAHAQLAKRWGLPALPREQPPPTPQQRIPRILHHSEKGHVLGGGWAGLAGSASHFLSCWDSCAVGRPCADAP